MTVKDCLKYQFKVEAAENPRDDSRLQEGQERGMERDKARSGLGFR